ncbi:MAG: CGNR zinc finger domain-containing protein, partial [Spirochaetota bacterium]
IGDNEYAELLKNAEKNPAEYASLLKKGINLRETIFRIFSSVVNEKEPAPEDMHVFNTFLSETMMNASIQYENKSFSWKFQAVGTPDSLFYPVIRSAADLLLSEELLRVRKCADKCCGWLFIDNSKNRSRKWCNMSDCGNRAKARRYYQRKTGKKEGQK